MKQKTLFWAILFAVLALAGAGFYILFGGGEAAVANVYIDGELYDSYDLSAVVFPYEVRIETEYGHNVVRVSRGAVEVAEADCSEQVCVNQGTITDELIPIVCLPHHLVIQIETE